MVTEVEDIKTNKLETHKVDRVIKWDSKRMSSTIHDDHDKGQLVLSLLKT